MLVSEMTYTLAEVAPASSAELVPGKQALLLVVGEHDTREELVWVQVAERLQAATHRARTLHPTECFPDLPAGSTVYFRPEHVVQVRSGNTHMLSGWSGAVLA